MTDETEPLTGADNSTEEPAEDPSQAVDGAETSEENPVNRFKNPVNCSHEQLVKVFLELDNPTCRTVHKELLRRGITCSLSWVQLKHREWNVAADVEAHRLKTGVNDVTILNARKVRDQLAGLGADFEPLLTLRGYQSRLLATMSVKLNDPDTPPDWHLGMIKVYAVVTDELTKTYQGRKAQGQDDKLPETRKESPEKVVPFTQGRKS